MQPAEGCTYYAHRLQPALESEKQWWPAGCVKGFVSLFGIQTLGLYIDSKETNERHGLTLLSSLIIYVIGSSGEGHTRCCRDFQFLTEGKKFWFHINS